MKLKINRYSFVLLGSAIALMGCSSHNVPSTVAAQQPLVKAPAAAAKPSPSTTTQGAIKPFYESEGNSLSASEEIDEEDVTAGPVIGE